MKFYSKPALQLLYDQVNRDNPQLPVTLTPEIAALTDGPITKSINGRNTQVTFTGFPGTGLQGRVVLYYDRVNLSKLFNFTPLVYLPATVAIVSDAIPFINEALGTTLTVDDLTTPTGTLPAPNAKPKALVITANVKSTGFIGSFTLNYMITAAGYYPNSGPGPKTLRIGNTMMGYFGIASATELMSRKDFMAAAFLKSTPTLLSGDEGWYKFFYQGSVVYLPVYPMVQTLSWNAIYAEGMVYGTDNTGLYPATPAVNQSRIIVCNAPEGRCYLRPRLPGYSLLDPSQGTPADKVGGEFDMISKLYTGMWSTPDNGAPFTSYVLTKTTVSTNTTLHLMGYLSGAGGFAQGKSVPYATGFWTPLVELVDNTTIVLGLEDVKGEVENTLKPVVFGANNSFELHPAILGNAKTVEFQPVTFQGNNSMTLFVAAQNLPKTVDFAPISFTASRIPTPVKTNLTSTDGELDGFN